MSIDQQLQRCTDARNAIVDAKRVYLDILAAADQAARAADTAKATVDASVRAAEAQIAAKEQTALDLLSGLDDLVTSIEDFPGSTDGMSPLEICEATRRGISVAAARADNLKTRAQQAADLSTISDAALQTAQSVWSDKKRIYEDAKSAVDAARGSIIAIAR